MQTIETPQQKENRLSQLYKKAQRFPGALKLGPETVRELAEYERSLEAQRLAKRQGTPGGRGSMTRQAKSDYIKKNGQAAYLQLPL